MIPYYEGQEDKHSSHAVHKIDPTPLRWAKHIPVCVVVNWRLCMTECACPQIPTLKP